MRDDPGIDLPHVSPADLADMLDPAKTALVVVDIQKDFAAPDGLLGRVGVDLTDAEAVIDRIEEITPLARAAGMTLAYMRVVTTPESDSDALKAFHTRRGDPGGQAICRTDDGGSDYYRVTPAPGDIEIEKLLYDSFHGTDLEQQLRGRGIDTLVITGLSTDCCVDQTARAAFHRNFNVFLVTDACGAYEAGLHQSSLNVLSKNCALLTTSADLKLALSA